mgnify:CR=1 FL=1
MAINIDTTANQYQQLYSGIDTLRSVMTPRLKALAKLPRSKQKIWVQNDPLMKRLLKLGLDLHAYLEKFAPEDLT